jgi:hypothetical protein
MSKLLFCGAVRTLVVVAVSFMCTAVAGSIVEAQVLDAPVCPAGGYIGRGPDPTKIAQDGCQKALDLFQYLAPQLALSLTGGNATSRSGGTIGKPGRVAIGVRATLVRGALPQATGVPLTPYGAQRSMFETRTQVFAIPNADLAVGLFNGFQVGPVRTAMVDALASATYIPEFQIGDVSITTSGSAFKFGLGARLGIVQETSRIPGVAATIVRRGLPIMGVDVGAGLDTLHLRDLSFSTTAWRLVLTKRLGFIQVMTGAGIDKYNTRSVIEATVAYRPDVSTDGFVPLAVTQTLKRTNVFVDLEILRVVSISVGRSSGGEIRTFNQVNGPRADDPRMYSTAAFSYHFGR